MKFFLPYMRSLAILLFCIAIASCSEDIFNFGDDEQLPPGSHPLKFIASVEDMKSRAAGADSWIDGDSILITINNYPDSSRYALKSDGTVMGADRLLDWTSSTGNVKGWYPAYPLPSIADQSEGLHHYDHMIAIAENQYYKDVVNLTFSHQMAKVTCTLVQGDDLTDEEFKSAEVRIFGDRKAYFEDTDLIGSDPEWIIPWSNTNAAYEEYKSSYSEFAALLVPEEISTEGLIRINLDVRINNVLTPREFIYKPDESRISVHEKGNHYRYIITVTRERIFVQESYINDWGGANENPGTLHKAVFRVNMPWADNNQTSIPEIVFTSFSDNVRACDSNDNVIDWSSGITPGDFDHLLVSGNDFTFTYTMLPDETENSAHNETRAFLAPDEDIYSMERTATLEGKSFKDEDAYFEITQKMTLKSRTVNLTYELYAEVGDYYYSDGTWLSSLVDSPDKYCIGLVFHTGPGLEDKVEFYSENTNFVDWPIDKGQERVKKTKITGYVLALHDAKMDVSYKNDSDYPYYNNQKDEYKNDEYVHRPGYIEYSYLGVSESDISRYFQGFIKYYADHKVYSGYHICKNLYPRLIDGYNSEKKYKMQTLPYQACLAYCDTWQGGGSVSTPPGSSGWYLPSFGQMYDAYKLPGRLKKFQNLGNLGNKIDEVYDFIADNVLDHDHSILYNTISHDLTLTDKSVPNSQFHIFFVASTTIEWFRSDLTTRFFSIVTTPPTRVRPILTF